MVIFLSALALLTLCCFFIIKSQFRFYLKITGIMILVGSSVFSFYVLDKYLGKPLYYETLPLDIMVYGSKIGVDKVSILCKETDKESDIFYLVTNKEKKLEEALMKGRRASKGKPFRLVKNLKKQGELGASEGDQQGKSKSGSSGASLSRSPFDYEIHNLPPPIMPDK